MTSSAHTIRSLPDPLRAIRTEETLDTEPNRFVLFVLRRWRQLAQQVLNILLKQTRVSGPVARGIDAAEEVITILDGVLAAQMFREVGAMRSFPSGNQVLQKRAGYREVFRTFALTETGARRALDWDVDDVFAASQRNVATLYEYWAFLQLAKVVGDVCGEDLSPRAFELSNDHLSMAFRRGKQSRMHWETNVRGRKLAVELYFNREFLVSAQRDSSWTQAMRPDCSIRIRPDGDFDAVSSDELAIWVHFDAKYRVEYADRQFTKHESNDGNLAADDEEVERLARSKREDLLKMHAYRDAIRHSAGAYVLFPGEQNQDPFTEHDEILPGLGAFVLRPAQHETLGTSHLEAFLVRVFDHAADRATQHERSRYWRTVVFRRDSSSSRADRRLPLLELPPADALVLCGYVRDRSQLEWIEHSGLYNVRAGDRRGSVDTDSDVLRAPDLLLYGRGLLPTLWSRQGSWFVQSRADMINLGYPTPGGSVYFCCPIERRQDEPEWLSQISAHIAGLGDGRSGTPFVTSWQELLRLAR